MSKHTEPTGQTGSSGRLPYHPPQIARIDLHADEVLVAGCKTLKGQRALGGSRCITLNCSKLDVS